MFETFGQILTILGMFMTFPSIFQVNLTTIYLYNTLYFNAMGSFTCAEAIY